MSITLSDEQIIYVQASGKVILNACPGSGKTTTIAHKLYSLIQNWGIFFEKIQESFVFLLQMLLKMKLLKSSGQINGFSLPIPSSNFDN